MKIFDISRDILTASVYPGDPEPRLKKVADIEKGAEYNLSEISMCLHNGTHIDAPLHFFNDGEDISSVDPSAFVGPCVVIEVPEGIITGAIVDHYFPRNTKRILIKSNGKAFLHETAATELAVLGCYLVGTDAQTIETADSCGRTHRALLTDNIAILEGLDLKNVQEGDYFLVAPPLKIEGAEAAPCRALLISDYIFWSGEKH